MRLHFYIRHSSLVVISKLPGDRFRRGEGTLNCEHQYRELMASVTDGDCFHSSGVRPRLIYLTQKLTDDAILLA